jgi:hypothetical protein
VKKSRKKRVVTVESSPKVDNPVVIAKPAPKVVPKKNEYFTKLHEEAIIKYASSTDRHEKSVLYVELIQPTFNEMVDKIVYTYKFTSLPNIEDLKEECKIWLTTILDKFDVTKGSKAFSYFSVITKNWFIHKVKKYSSGREVSLDEITESFEEENLFVTNGYDEDRETREFWDHFMTEMDTWEGLSLKANEKKIFEAIRILLKDPDGVQIFNKKAVYLYIRELTGLTTKQIVTSLRKFKTKYYKFRKKWDSGDI